ncbi:MAG: hypothetical protein P1V97_19400 [Planctomycetota bacterium]|nr:hypothetical protein [Planctomycetota bacterium]
MTNKSAETHDLSIPDEFEDAIPTLLQLVIVVLLIVAFFMLLPSSNRPDEHVLSRFLNQLLAFGTG